MAFNVNPSVARVGTKRFEKVVNPELPTLVVMEAPTKKGGNFKFNINQEALVLLGYTAEQVAKGECYVYLMPDANTMEWLIAGQDAYDTIVNIAEAKNESVNVVMDRFSGCTGMNGNFSNKILHSLFSTATGIDTTIKHYYELVKVEDADTNFEYAKLVETTEEALKNRISVTTSPIEVSVQVVDAEPLKDGAFKELLEEVANF